MQQQIRQGNSLIAPFTMPPPSGISESKQNSQIIVPETPLDFLLPFTVAANMNAGLRIGENLRAVTAGFRQTRSSEKTDDDSDLLDLLMTNARLPFASDPVKPWEYQGWLLPYVILANAARSDVVNHWGWWMNAICKVNSPASRFRTFTSVLNPVRAQKTLSKILTAAWR